MLTESEFNRLWAEVGETVELRARRQLKDPEMVEEVVQDVAVRLWSCYDKYDSSKGTLLQWLSVVTKNLCIDRIRKERRTTLFDRREMSPARLRALEQGYIKKAIRLAGGDGALVEMLDESPSAVETLIWAEARDRIETALATCPRPHRTAWILYHLEDFDISDGARIMGCPRNTYKVWVYRANQKMKRQLKGLQD